MLSKNSETSTKKTNTEPSKSKKNTLSSKTNVTKARDDGHKMITEADYLRAEKRGFKSNGADTVQDWLEDEVEISNVRWK